VRSWAKFEPPLQYAIHRLKYKNDIGLAEVLVEHLSPLLINADWEIDLIVPVPLDQDRLKVRGYNQSSLLGESLAKIVKIPFSDKAIQRKKITRSQIGLTKEERKINVRDAFQVCTPVVTGKNILVVDDVITTGATLNACSKELRIAGANVVFGLTVARSLHL
jgi:ComF family protein